jgi:hypothetical protein
VLGTKADKNVSVTGDVVLSVNEQNDVIIAKTQKTLDGADDGIYTATIKAGANISFEFSGTAPDTEIEISASVVNVAWGEDV